MLSKLLTKPLEYEVRERHPLHAVPDAASKDALQGGRRGWGWGGGSRLSKGAKSEVVMVVVGKHFTCLLIVVWWNPPLNCQSLIFLFPFQPQPSTHAPHDHALDGRMVLLVRVRACKTT